MNTSYPRVCIIGAGSSGIAVVKAMNDRGIPFDCFEKCDQVGGNWCFQNKNGMSSAYRSLHINTSRNLMQYADYPMPPDYPTYPGHALIKKDFDSYIDHFGLRKKITFETTVTRAENCRTQQPLTRFFGPLTLTLHLRSYCECLISRALAKSHGRSRA